MSVKLLISKPTKNVLTVTSPNDFFLNSDYSLLKVHSYGTFSIDSPGGHVGYDVTHNLGWMPFAIVYANFVDVDGTVSSEYYQLSWDILTTGYIFGYIYTTTAQLQIRVGGPVNGDKIVYGFYYIFYQAL